MREAEWRACEGGRDIHAPPLRSQEAEFLDSTHADAKLPLDLAGQASESDYVCKGRRRGASVARQTRPVVAFTLAPDGGETQ